MNRENHILLKEKGMPILRGQKKAHEEMTVTPRADRYNERRIADYGRKHNRKRAHALSIKTRIETR